MSAVSHDDLGDRHARRRGRGIGRSSPVVSSPDAISGVAPPLGELAVVRVQASEQLILHVSGELDLATAPVLELELELAWAGDPGALVLDLHELTFIDSTGLRLIVDTHRRAVAEEKRFSVRRLPRQAQRLFDLVGLTGRLPVEP